MCNSHTKNLEVINFLSSLTTKFVLCFGKTEENVNDTRKTFLITDH